MSRRLLCAALSLLAAPALAAEQVTVSPYAAQTPFDASLFNALIDVHFSSDLGIGEVTFGGGYTVSCDSPNPGAGLPASAPTPVVSNTIHLDPVFPFAIFDSTLRVGGENRPIPDFLQMPFGSSRVCRLVYNSAANYSNFPIGFSAQAGGAEINVISERIDQQGQNNYLPFTVIRPGGGGGGGCAVVGGESGLLFGDDGGSNLMSPDDPPCDPLLLDLGQDGIELGPRGVGVTFDTDADGYVERIQWVREGGDEAFLVLDVNGNGRVDDGSELFGNGTLLALEGRRAPNGFVALSQYDDPALGGNDDGLITAEDAIWDELRLWLDSDADGVSTPGELMGLGDGGLRALPTIPRDGRGREDAAGNSFPYWGYAITSSRPRRMLMVDVLFQPF